MTMRPRTLEEQETVITWSAKYPTVDFFTAIPWMMKKMDELCETYPSDYKVTESGEDYRRYEFDYHLLSFKKPLTAEQREAKARNFK